MKVAPIARCPLCLKDGKKLHASHFICKGLYRIAGKDSAPVVMTPGAFVSVSTQVKDYLLCWDCEQAFSKREDYVIPLLKHGDDFPLLAMLKASTPIGQLRDGSLVFSGSVAGVDTDKLAYFAFSMFWRASVHVWRTLKGQVTTQSHFMRNFEEPIRRYLHGESAFPAGMVMRVSVCTDVVSQGMFFSPVGWVDGPNAGYEMTTFGVRYTMVPRVEGNAQNFWNSCCVNTKNKVLFLEDGSATTYRHYDGLRRAARMAKNLTARAG